MGEALRCHKCQPGFEVSLRLTWETHDQVGGHDQPWDRGVRWAAASSANDAVVQRRAMWPAELSVRAGLQGQVEMGTEPLRPARPQVKKAGSEFPRLQAAQAQTGNVRVSQDGRRQRLEVSPFCARQIASQLPKCTPVSTASRT